MRSEATIKESALGSDIALDQLSNEELETMVEAGQEVTEIHRLLAKTSDNIVGELLKNNGTFYEWDHYPPGMSTTTRPTASSTTTPMPRTSASRANTDTSIPSSGPRGCRRV